MIDDQKMCKQERSRGQGEEENIFLPNYPFPVTYEAVGFGNEANLSK